MKTMLLVLALALAACSTAEQPQQMTPRPEPVAASDHADVYADTVDAITAELDIELDDPPDASPTFPTVEAARLEALDEAAEALNRAYLEGTDACVDASHLHQLCASTILDSMVDEQELSIDHRARVHRALADETRLAIVDALWAGDQTPAQLRSAMGLESNLLAFHLDVLEEAGLISRHGSQGDGRRRYATLEPVAVPFVGAVARLAVQCVLFVCTHNAARSQFAAALWRQTTDREAVSAGTQPADEVHPHAVAVAADHGLDLSNVRPRHLTDVAVTPDLVVSVCDRANESGLPSDVPRRHWSIPDPLGGDRRTFEAAYQSIADRVDRLARQTIA